MPSFIHYREDGRSSLNSFGAYGLADPGVGGRRTTYPGTAVKVGEERVRTVVDPADGPFEVADAALRRLADYVEIWLPGLDPMPMRAETCLFTSTGNDDFVLDRRGPLRGGVTLLGPRLQVRAPHRPDGGRPGAGRDAAASLDPRFRLHAV